MKLLAMLAAIVLVSSWLFLSGFRGGALPAAATAASKATPGGCAGFLATGQTKCYDQQGAEISCGDASCPGQDAFYQRGCPPEGRFVDNGDGTVTDHCTGLMWQKETADLDGDGELTGKDAAPWDKALRYCENLTHAGLSDWRLPGVNELRSIQELERPPVWIDPSFDALPGDYWSSTSHVVSTEKAWFRGFGTRLVGGADPKRMRHFVRAVRDAW